MAKRFLHLLVGGLVVAAYFAACPEHLWFEKPQLEARATYTVPDHDNWQTRWVSGIDTRMVHAASAVALPDGRLRAFWFAGSREGAADVTIRTAVFDPQTGAWGQETVAISRQDVVTGWGRHVRKLGNAVPVLDDNGRMRLFVVAVSFGGWAASRVVVFESEDMGNSWAFDKPLTLSPLLNISTLVKTPALRYSDGSIGLPVYHEMIGKFGEILRLDEQSRVLEKARIGSGRKAIQPLLLVDSEQRAAAFLRNENEPNNGFLYQSFSDDAARQWQPLTYSSLENPSAALGGMVVSPGHWLLVANCNRDERDDLCVRESHDSGQSWTTRWMFHDRAAWRAGEVSKADFLDLIAAELPQQWSEEQTRLWLERVADNKCHVQKGCEFQYDYPYMLRANNGDIHVLYTWNKTAIRHLWLRSEESSNTLPVDDSAQETALAQEPNDV